MYIQPSNKKKFTTPKSNIAYSKNIRTRRKLRTKKRSAKAGARKKILFLFYYESEESVIRLQNDIQCLYIIYIDRI